MLFAIKYETNKRGLKIANITLKRYDSAVMFSGKNTNVFFTNPIVALKVAHQLNKVNKHLTYKVYKLTNIEERRGDESLMVSTLEEYETLKDAQWGAAIKKIENLKAKQSKEIKDNCEYEKTL